MGIVYLTYLLPKECQSEYPQARGAPLFDVPHNRDKRVSLISVWLALIGLFGRACRFAERSLNFGRLVDQSTPCYDDPTQGLFQRANLKLGMDPTKDFPLTDEEMVEAGFLGEDVSCFVKQAIESRKEHPELFDFFTPFVLECVDEWGKRNGSGSPVSPASPTTIASDATAVSSLFISDYERTAFYNGIAPGGNHPELFYRSDLLTNPFPVPKGRYTSFAIKSARPVHNTPLNGCWDTVAPKIVTLLKRMSIRYSAIDPVRFFTHGPPGEEEKGTLGPVIIWIAVHPGTTTVEAAHDASLDILELLKDNGVDDVVVQWREGAPERLSGPALLPMDDETQLPQHARRFLTAALGMAIAPASKQKDDAQGSIAFFFHENRDKKGNPIDTVLGVSNCHVLSEDVTVDYEFNGLASGAPAKFVRVNGLRRFQRGLEDIKDCISVQTVEANSLATEIVELKERLKSEDQEKADADADTKLLVVNEAKLAEIKDDIKALNKFYQEVTTSQWCDIESRNIGYVHWAPKMSVDVQGHKYTKDIGTFVADPKKFKPHFKGNVISLGAKYTRKQLNILLHPKAGGQTTFKFPLRGQLRINGCVSREQLANPDSYDGNGEPCFIVMKDGNTTDLTVGRYVGLMSYLSDELGVESIELAIHNYDKQPDPFSSKGDSGSLVFNGQGRMVGIIHSGISVLGIPHVTYATPAWWVIEELKKKYPYADFNRISF